MFQKIPSSSSLTLGTGGRPGKRHPGSSRWPPPRGVTQTVSFAQVSAAWPPRLAQWRGLCCRAVREVGPLPPRVHKAGTEYGQSLKQLERLPWLLLGPPGPEVPPGPRFELSPALSLTM